MNPEPCFLAMLLQKFVCNADLASDFRNRLHGSGRNMNIDPLHTSSHHKMILHKTQICKPYEKPPICTQKHREKIFSVNHIKNKLRPAEHSQDYEATQLLTHCLSNYIPLHPPLFISDTALHPGTSGSKSQTAHSQCHCAGCIIAHKYHQV